MLAEGLLVWSVTEGYLLLTLAAVLLVAHLAHGQLMAFHEAAHGVLLLNQLVNEVVGCSIGILHFNSLSLFRAAHHSHHAYLATERDDELWPYVNPRLPRWLRCLAAGTDLCLAIVFEPIKFWRAYLKNPRPSPGLPASLARNLRDDRVWSVILSAVAYWSAWTWLLLAFLIPAVLAGSLHVLRTFIEHMGMSTGTTVEGLSRTVAPAGPLGRLLAMSLFNVTYHGVHHVYARLSPHALPNFVEELAPRPPHEPETFRSYWHAFCAMIPTLTDPKIGPSLKSMFPLWACPNLNGSGVKRPMHSRVSWFPEPSTGVAIRLAVADASGSDQSGPSRKRKRRPRFHSRLLS